MKPSAENTRAEPVEAKGNYCHLCGTGPSQPVPGFEKLPRITSDCKPWPSGGHLFLCRQCGSIHKNTDAVWLDEISRIYADYTIYHQSGGIEQPVFAPHAGGLLPRSKCLLDCLRAAVELPRQGRVLDVGCGNGGFLRVFSADMPEWSLAGTEYSEKYKADVERIPRVERLYTGPLEEIPGQFNMATMVHSLEHIPWPGALMTQIHQKLNDDGRLVIDIPDYQLNPFELVVADHCSHFTEAALTGFVGRHGFVTTIATTAWIPKERVLVAGKSRVKTSDDPAGSPDDVVRTVNSALWFLESLMATARRLRGHASFGLFGTSIAGTWLCGALGGDIDFFVEEDPDRIGRAHMGKPLLAPEDVPDGSHVLIAVSPKIVEHIHRQLVARKCRGQLYRPVLPASN